MKKYGIILIVAGITFICLILSSLSINYYHDNFPQNKNEVKNQDPYQQPEKVIAICGNAMSSEVSVLMKSECDPCHKINMDFVGPKIGGLSKTMDYESFKIFISSQDSLLKTEDSSLIQQFKDFGGIWIHQYDLKESEYKALYELN